MIMRVEHIDAIARTKKRDVIYVEFHYLVNPRKREYRSPYDELVLDWEHLSARKIVADWLDAKAIHWSPCAEFADLNCLVSYRGQMYIDIPYDKKSSAFQLLEAFLEDTDGSALIPGVRFLYCTLEQALVNASHDEPGFWGRWAETF
jgi:hypothetical protein